MTQEFAEAALKHMESQKKIHKKYVFQILLAIKDMFVALPPIIDIDVPEGTNLTICGDIHGQFYDLLNIFKLNGLPSPTIMYLVSDVVFFLFISLIATSGILEGGACRQRSL